jgi:hypothetical protein
MKYFYSEWKWIEIYVICLLLVASGADTGLLTKSQSLSPPLAWLCNVKCNALLQM